jgi:hypothetical protein
MLEFDAGDRDGGIVEDLEAEHRSSPRNQEDRAAHDGFQIVLVGGQRLGWNRDHAYDPQGAVGLLWPTNRVRCRPVLLFGPFRREHFRKSLAVTPLSRQNRRHCAADRDIFT